MHFDALTLACVADELKATILGGRVQQVLLPDDHSIGLEVYAKPQRHYLLATTAPAASRVQLTSYKLRRGTDAQSPLLLLLRKYARGGLLAAIEQPDPTERVLTIQFDHPQHGTTTLVVEIIGRQSNLILLGPEDRILNCLRRVRPTKPNQRVLQPNHIYTPPPRQDRLSPYSRLRRQGDDHTSNQDPLSALLQSAEPLWQGLVKNIAGISPTVARELAWRATGDVNTVAQTTSAARLAQEMDKLWSLVADSGWQPGLLYENAQVIGFTPYLSHIVHAFVPTTSISQALETFYAERAADTAKSHDAEPPNTQAPVATTTSDAYATQRATTLAQLKSAQKRVQRQLDALASDEPAPGEPAALRVKAEWLLALSSQIAPDQETLEVDLGDQTLEIKLDATKTPVVQAERYFDRAAKLERAAQIIPVRRAKLEADRDFLQQLESDVALAENQPELVAVEKEMQRAGLLAQPMARQGKQKSGSAAAQPLRYVSPDGMAIVVGRNARQNDMVTFKIANADDLWLHVRDAPGSHVVVRSGGQPVSAETLESAAQLAAYYSKLRGELAVPVAVTQKRFVTRVPGGRPGLVYLRNEETVTVPGNLPQDVSLFRDKKARRHQ